MSDGHNSQVDGNKIIFSDFTELWKELYFKNEGAWANAFKELVSTETFVKMLDQTLTQHLSLEKITRQNMNKLFELSSVPSKKDLARIAELVISVEEKVDNLDYQLLDNINRMADSLLTLTGLLEKNQQQFTAMNRQNSELNKQLAELQTHNTELHNQTDSIIASNIEMKAQLTDIKKQNIQFKSLLSDMKKQVAGLNQKLTVLNGVND